MDGLVSEYYNVDTKKERFGHEKKVLTRSSVVFLVMMSISFPLCAHDQTQATSDWEVRLVPYFSGYLP